MTRRNGSNKSVPIRRVKLLTSFFCITRKTCSTKSVDSSSDQVKAVISVSLSTTQATGYHGNSKIIYCDSDSAYIRISVSLREWFTRKAFFKKSFRFLEKMSKFTIQLI